MVKEGQKGDSTYRAPRKAFPLNKKKSLGNSSFTVQPKKLLHLNVTKVNSRRNMFFRKIKKIAL